MYQKQFPLVYQVSEWDAFQWEDYLERHPKQKRSLSVGEQKIFSFRVFASEVFHRLYAVEPKILKSPTSEAQWAMKAHQTLSEIPEFNQLITTIEVEAASDTLKKWQLAGVGAASFCEQIAQSLPIPQKTLVNPQTLRQQFLAARKRLKQLLAQAQTQQKILDAPNSQTAQIQTATQIIEQLAPQIADLQEQLEAIATEGTIAVELAQTYADEICSLFSKEVVDALSYATEAVRRTADALNAFSWGSQSGSLGTGGSISKKLQLASLVLQKPKLVRIAKLAGRMKLMAAKKQRSKTTSDGTAVHSVETGNNLQGLLPSELAKLAIPGMRPLFLKDYSERSLLQYQLKSKERQGKGPIVVCLDSSGSMAGELEEWSKAVAIALFSIANRQKRTCRILHFTNRVERVDDFIGGQLDPLKLVESMESFYNGGTNWEVPLDSALEVIHSSPNYRKADIVMITDGDCAVSSFWLDEFKQQQRKLEFTTFGVLLGRSSQQSLAQVVDRLVAIDNLEDDCAVETVFAI
jgi:uncharacterized protein with von Willebrand factor type A (vWA) domain